MILVIFESFELLLHRTSTKQNKTFSKEKNTVCVFHFLFFHHFFSNYLKFDLFKIIIIVVVVYILCLNNLFVISLSFHFHFQISFNFSKSQCVYLSSVLFVCLFSKSIFLQICNNRCLFVY